MNTNNDENKKLTPMKEIPNRRIYKAIPLAFDESLSWLEELSAILYKINEVIEQTNQNTDDIINQREIIENIFTKVLGTTDNLWESGISYAKGFLVYYYTKDEGIFGGKLYRNDNVTDFTITPDTKNSGWTSEDIINQLNESYLFDLIHDVDIGNIQAVLGNTSDINIWKPNTEYKANNLVIQANLDTALESSTRLYKVLHDITSTETLPQNDTENYVEMTIIEAINDLANRTLTSIGNVFLILSALRVGYYEVSGILDYEYDNTHSYNKGDYVYYAVDGTGSSKQYYLYKSLKSYNENNNPKTAIDYWERTSIANELYILSNTVGTIEKNIDDLTIRLHNVEIGLNTTNTIVTNFNTDISELHKNEILTTTNVGDTDITKLGLNISKIGNTITYEPKNEVFMQSGSLGICDKANVELGLHGINTNLLFNIVHRCNNDIFSSDIHYYFNNNDLVYVPITNKETNLIIFIDNQTDSFEIYGNIYYNYKKYSGLLYTINGTSYTKNINDLPNINIELVNNDVKGRKITLGNFKNGVIQIISKFAFKGYTNAGVMTNTTNNNYLSLTSTENCFIPINDISFEYTYIVNILDDYGSSLNTYINLQNNEPITFTHYYVDTDNNKLHEITDFGKLTNGTVIDYHTIDKTYIIGDNGDTQILSNTPESITYNSEINHFTIFGVKIKSNHIGSDIDIGNSNIYTEKLPFENISTTYNNNDKYNFSNDDNDTPYVPDGSHGSYEPYIPNDSNTSSNDDSNTSSNDDSSEP